MAKHKQEWIPFRQLVNEDESFEPCPRCKGKVTHPVFGGLMPMPLDPKCEICGCSFKRHKKYHIFDGFRIIVKTEEE